ncbi:hypothetical protein ABZZ79_33870 [Streptomyces sp. NPDC006458]|uniref:hypothetical protein n=1 Tax=Streptomyces sp. NPDC006458 TaxID=3154302 RepID=UPI0033B361C2
MSGLLDLHDQTLMDGRWHALYPGPPRIRVNLSVPHADLVSTLAVLHTALRR